MATDDDASFAARIQSAIHLVQQWEDLTLLRQCRSSIPFGDLRDDKGPYSQPTTDRRLASDVRFLQRLARYFQQSMTWVNQPSCEACGDSTGTTTTTVLQETRGPVTDLERQGQASRVEVYVCPQCHTHTTFPRYNHPSMLLQTRQGRCGEYANLFGLYCRASGFVTRYVADWTDHVWIEVWVPGVGSWIMVDACEAVVGECSMYEHGWNKSLNYIVAVSTDSSVVDVTPRYTRQFHTHLLLDRRRGVTTSEAAGQAVIVNLRTKLQAKLGPKEREQVQQRLVWEEQQLEQLKHLTVWDKEYEKGRISGSYEWKVARHEVGTHQQGTHPTVELYKFPVETFYPVASNVSIFVHPTPTRRHDGIVVSGTACAVGSENTLSVVVIDQDHLGCILQSRAFSTIQALAAFLDTLPVHRIVAIQGCIAEATIDEHVEKQCSNVLGGFQLQLVMEGVLFIGQVRAHPQWARCETFVTAPNGFGVQSKTATVVKELKLRTWTETNASAVAGRLPESVMPFQTQLLAGHEQKRMAVESFFAKDGFGKYSGYTTKKNCPVYLLGSSAFPLAPAENDGDDCWATFLLLPPPLVPVDDVGIVETPPRQAAATPLYDIPVDADFFTQSLGVELWSKHTGLASTVDTLAALHNVRLVGFYFSAHWCGPCRSFTPMLAEMYVHLKEVFPTHGLEIVFVSSDRDLGSFDRYYASMPWVGLPFEGSMYKQQLSAKYSIRGIPSLVIVDALSGEVVVSASASRQEVIQACNRGDEGIEALLRNWLDRAPAPSKEMIAMLELSCVETYVPSRNNETENPYLLRKSIKEETADLIKAKFVELGQQGLAPNEAAAKAIANVTQSSVVDDLGPLNDTFVPVDIPDNDLTTTRRLQRVVEAPNGPVVLSTLLKYVVNAQKSPSTPKFRQFKLSNKVADRIVTGGIDLVHAFGLEVIATPSDYCCSIPLVTDLDLLVQDFESTLKEVAK